MSQELIARMLSWVPTILIVIVVFFGFTIPQKIQQRKQKRAIAGLGAGDKVTTLSGMSGIVVNHTENYVEIKMNDSNCAVFLEWGIDKIEK